MDDNVSWLVTYNTSDTRAASNHLLAILGYMLHEIVRQTVARRNRRRWKRQIWTVHDKSNNKEAIKKKTKKKNENNEWQATTIEVHGGGNIKENKTWQQYITYTGGFDSLQSSHQSRSKYIRT